MAEDIAGIRNLLCNSRRAKLRVIAWIVKQTRPPSKHIQLVGWREDACSKDYAKLWNKLSF